MTTCKTSMPISISQMRSWKKSPAFEIPCRCMGIDPGIGRLGFGVIECDGSRCGLMTSGCIETDSSSSTAHRLRQIYEELREQVEGFSPQLVAVERLFFGRNTTTAELVWQARGVVLLLAAQRDLPLLEPKPAEIKNAICGYGRAPKDQVQRMVAAMLGLDTVPTPDDVADALACAVTALVMAGAMP
ncbi:MAG TPA: crossover junction endodeoxyribonuclease RuvC [Thermosynergistes sp.]|nr:crossover junction endodeoxyribonuclease RuvC [Thermosynergistes sp.]